MIITKIHALHSLKPTSEWTWTGTAYSGLNWLDSSIDRTNLNCLAKIRSNQKELPGTLNINKLGGKFIFDQKVHSTSPGQACVLYLNNQVLGGGWIVKS